MERSFDVYGVGHALVDIQYRVDVETLDKLGIEKGVMTLIDSQRQQALFEQLNRDPIASASGGSAANTMIGISQFGGKPFYACLTGRDTWGDFYQTDLEKAGVATDPAHRTDGTTGQCVVFITPDADRTLNTFLGVGSAIKLMTQLDGEKIADSRYIYLEGYLLSSDNGFDTCLQAQAMAQRVGTSVALTLSDPFMVATFKDRFTQLVDNGVDVTLLQRRRGQHLHRFHGKHAGHRTSRPTRSPGMRNLRRKRRTDPPRRALRVRTGYSR